MTHEIFISHGVANARTQPTSYSNNKTVDPVACNSIFEPRASLRSITELIERELKNLTATNRETANNGARNGMVRYTWTDGIDEIGGDPGSKNIVHHPVNVQSAREDTPKKARFLCPNSTPLPNPSIIQSQESALGDPLNDEAEQPVRKESVASDSSDFLHPTAFVCHRDTLVRLHSSDTDIDIPPQTCASFFQRPFHASYRDSLARLHFEQNSRLVLPGKILINILRYLGPSD